MHRRWKTTECCVPTDWLCPPFVWKVSGDRCLQKTTPSASSAARVKVGCTSRQKRDHLMCSACATSRRMLPSYPRFPPYPPTPPTTSFPMIHPAPCTDTSSSDGEWVDVEDPPSWMLRRRREAWMAWLLLGLLQKRSKRAWLLRIARAAAVRQGPRWTRASAAAAAATGTPTATEARATNTSTTTTTAAEAEAAALVTFPLDMRNPLSPTHAKKKHTKRRRKGGGGTAKKKKTHPHTRSKQGARKGGVVTGSAAAAPRARLETQNMDENEDDDEKQNEEEEEGVKTKKTETCFPVEPHWHETVPPSNHLERNDFPVQRVLPETKKKEERKRKGAGHGADARREASLPRPSHVEEEQDPAQGWPPSKPDGKTKKRAKRPKKRKKRKDSEMHAVEVLAADESREGAPGVGCMVSPDDGARYATDQEAETGEAAGHIHHECNDVDESEQETDPATFVAAHPPGHVQHDAMDTLLERIHDLTLPETGPVARDAACDTHTWRMPRPPPGVVVVPTQAHALPKHMFPPPGLLFPTTPTTALLSSSHAFQDGWSLFLPQENYITSPLHPVSKPRIDTVSRHPFGAVGMRTNASLNL